MEPASLATSGHAELQQPQRVPNFGAFTIGEFLKAVEKSSYADCYQTLSDVVWQDNIEPHRLVTHDRKLSELARFEGLRIHLREGTFATLWTTSGYLVPDHFGANMHLSAHKGTLPSTLIGKMPRHRKVLPEKTLTDIQKWLQVCHSKHDCFQMAQSERSNPTRLIKISSENGNSTLKLVETSATEPYSWCALSYCWGNDLDEKDGGKAIKAIQTTWGNLTTYLEEIPMEGLPQTLKDAIFITSQLGIEYIWIDCLCIVQNDNDHDKQHELTKMPAVYQQSYVTLSASSAAESTDGFLRDREFDHTEEDMIPCLINLYHDSTQQGQVLAHDESASHSKFQGKDPILNRAWTLQEALLSPRLLEFSAGQVRWRCSQQRTSDSYKSALDNRFMISEHISQASHHLQDPRLRELEWQKILTQYWPRDVRYERDRLLAISALARVFGQCATKPGERYLAGMWENALPFNLLWHVTELNGELTDGYRAPTWSWASLKGDGGQFSQECCRVLEETRSLARVVQCAVVTSPSENPYATVTSASITLRGQVNFMKELQDLGEVSPSAFTAAYVKRLRKANCDMWNVYIDRKRNLQMGPAAQLVSPPNICVMPIAETARIERTPGVVRGLLLQYDPTSDTYKRIGMFHHGLVDLEVAYPRGPCTYGVPGWEDREVKIL
ncbi:hypothetical protein BP6252_11756 [Coleophoma cylindrospora]|uniref:Heterokaryon incompatibility domain-containing protein n=1 Tax=Coleophoma cylindrospora TaxID=1849047 RepID=A0A3D8QKH0_9HELO|nr:hypothetical protein BP6252_11756 [Coleophoma cylindrospora]